MKYNILNAYLIQYHRNFREIKPNASAGGFELAKLRYYFRQFTHENQLEMKTKLKFAALALCYRCEWIGIGLEKNDKDQLIEVNIA